MNRPTRLSRIAVPLCTAMLLLAACNGAGTGGGGGGGGEPRPEYAELMLQLVNDFRASPQMCGTDSFDAAAPLVWNEQLARAASLHSQYLAEVSFNIGGTGDPHIGRGGSTLGERLAAQGYDFRVAGENVAAGQADPQTAISDWQLSPAHCSTMMNPDYRELGAGHDLDGEVIYWTQNFGTRR